MNEWMVLCRSSLTESGENNNNALFVGARDDRGGKKLRVGLPGAVNQTHHVGVSGALL